MTCKTNDQLNLHYEIHGNENAEKSIIFLNGLSQATISWLLTIPFFKEKYKIILMDFIFQGQSDKTGEYRNFDTHAADVITLLNHLKIEKVFLAGLSYGSLVAQHLAVNNGERIEKLILISTFAHKTAYSEAIELAWWRSLEIGGYALMLDIMLPTVLGEDYFKNPLIPIEMMKQMRQDANNDKEALFKLMQATKERIDYRQELKKVKVPTLVIQGQKDLLFPVHMAQEVSNAIPGAQLEVIPFAGHTLNLEAVPQMSGLIKKFIEA